MGAGILLITNTLSGLGSMPEGETTCPRNLRDSFKKLHFSYPIPRMDSALEYVGYATIFSKIDLVRGYYLIEVHRNYNYCTSFQTYFDFFKYIAMHLVLSNIPSIV